MSVALQYTYAVIDLNDGFCFACYTSTNEINQEDHILVPELDDYMDKYYNLNGDQMWYWDAEFTQLWEECPSHNA